MPGFIELQYSLKLKIWMMINHKCCLLDLLISKRVVFTVGKILQKKLWRVGVVSDVL
jgi:hypothetical protein